MQAGGCVGPRGVGREVLTQSYGLAALVIPVRAHILHNAVHLLTGDTVLVSVATSSSPSSREAH